MSGAGITSSYRISLRCEANGVPRESVVKSRRARREPGGRTFRNGIMFRSGTRAYDRVHGFVVNPRVSHWNRRRAPAIGPSMIPFGWRLAHPMLRKRDRLAGERWTQERSIRRTQTTKETEGNETHERTRNRASNDADGNRRLRRAVTDRRHPGAARPGCAGSARPYG